MKINSQISLGKKLQNYSEDVIKNEPMLFRCDYESAFFLAGEPTRQFLKSLPEDWMNNKTIVDSRVHMLMKGWFPCIPGYHHDDVPRERSDGQPEYFNPSYRSEHAMVLFNGDICPTEFALGEVEFNIPETGKIIYKELHPEVEACIEGGFLQKFLAPSEQLIFFNDRTWHQGTQAVEKGWRLFIRATRNTNLKPANEIRKQVQVYLENPMEGW